MAVALAVADAVAVVRCGVVVLCCCVLLLCCCVLLRTSPLAVITVVGFFDILMVSNSAESRSRLLTVCMLAPEKTTNSLSSDFMVDAADLTHPSQGE